MCTLLAFLSVSTWQAGAQFVDVTAEISSIQWRSTKAISEVSTVQCVVGLNSWQIKSETSQYPKSTYFYWFTGKHFIERSSSFPIEAIPDGPPPTWLERTNIVASDDGNPSGPRKFEDLMGGDERAAWLAFCSGQYLQREGREIFPPVFSWKFEIWPSFAPDAPISLKTPGASRNEWILLPPMVNRCFCIVCRSPRICSAGNFRWSSMLFNIARSTLCVSKLPITTPTRGWWTGLRLAGLHTSVLGPGQKSRPSF